MNIEALKRFSSKYNLSTDGGLMQAAIDGHGHEMPPFFFESDEMQEEYLEICGEGTKNEEDDLSDLQ